VPGLRRKESESRTLGQPLHAGKFILLNKILNLFYILFSVTKKNKEKPFKNICHSQTC
jgi:hypothetical protein